MRWIVALLFVIVSLAPVQAQAPDPGDYSSEKFQVKISRGQRVAMRDGVKLAVDVFEPKTEGRYPAILIITPYNAANPGFGNRGAFFVRRGYVVVVADSRGRFESEGDWDPFDAKHKTDGYDLVEWMAKQPWCTGKVGMLSASYMGWTQWWTASQAPPSLKAIVPEVAPPDHFFNGPYQHGVLVGWMMDWAAGMSERKFKSVGPGPYGGFAATRGKDFLHLPYVELNKARKAGTPWFEKWIHQNTAAGDYWKAISYQGKDNYAKITVPSLNLTGWFDANYPGAPMNYMGMKQHGANPQAKRPSLVIGPWEHGFNRRKVGNFDYGPTAQINWEGNICRWFDHFLKGIDNGVEKDPPVHVFVMGRNRWHAEKDWPLPQTRWTKYYLHSKGAANTLKGDGTLSTEPPADEPADKYVYDPAKPTPSLFTGGHTEQGAIDTRPSAARDDMLVYTTPPLETDVEVTGPISAKLYAATSAHDTDWMVRLIDVRPDGYAALLCDGVLRARCRDPKNGGAFNPSQFSKIEPDKAYEYTVDFWRGTGNVFAKDHRIRVEISSSYYPYYLRNLNTGADNVGLETKSVVARQTIYHDAARPSHVVLPVIPQRK